MPTVTESWLKDAEERVFEAIRRQELPLLPKSIKVVEETDASGEDAWRLILVLPAPAGETWDVTEAFRLRRAAVRAFDAHALESGRELPGATVARMTTDEADEQDIAPEEDPEDGEGAAGDR